MRKKISLQSSHSEENKSDQFSDRMNVLCERVNGGAALARMAGVSESVIRKWRQGESEPTVSKLLALAVAAEVSLTWLATGEGAMLISDEMVGFQKAKNKTESSTDSVASLAGELLSELGVKIDPSDYAYIPLYDAQCSAGHGSWNEDCKVLTHISFTKYSLRKQGLDSKTLSAIRVDGDSMEGVISDGDAVLIDHSKQEIRGEGVYVLRLDGHLYAKRLQRHFDGVAIISENKAYETITVPKERLNELEIIGQVVWSGGWMS